MSLRFKKAFPIDNTNLFGGSGGQKINNEDITITRNGEYTASEGYTGIGTATVNVQPTLVTKTITENGVYNASDDDADGYSQVTSNVPKGGMQASTLIASITTAIFNSMTSQSLIGSLTNSTMGAMSSTSTEI